MSSHSYPTRKNSKGVNILDTILSASDSETTHTQQQSATTTDNMYTQAQQQQQQPAAGMQHLGEDSPSVPGITGMRAADDGMRASGSNVAGMRAMDDGMRTSGSNFAAVGMQHNAQHRDREAAMQIKLEHKHNYSHNDDLGSDNEIEVLSTSRGAHYLNIQPMKFNPDSVDVEEWLDHFNIIADSRQMKGIHRCLQLPAFLEGRAALTWWKRVVTDDQKKNWLALQASLIKHFKPADQQSHALNQLVQRQQLPTEAVNTYMSAQLELSLIHI